MSKPVKQKWAIISIQDEPWIYEQIRKMQATTHQDIGAATIAAAWMIGGKPDTDGRLTLGKCIKAPELWARLTDFDFVVGLNRRWWSEADEGARLFLIDHELCHARPALDEEEQKLDETGRLQWRIAKHDIEEFSGPVERHGLRLPDLQRFFRVAEKAQATLPFDMGIEILDDTDDLSEQRPN